LPVRDNRGRRVSPEVFEQTWDELATRFGGISGAPELFRGAWIDGGIRFEEEMRRLTVDVANTAANQRFFARCKATLRKRFKQVEIYIVSYLVDIV
jgi:hypothetical protein